MAARARDLCKPAGERRLSARQRRERPHPLHARRECGRRQGRLENAAPLAACDGRAALRLGPLWPHKKADAVRHAARSLERLLYEHALSERTGRRRQQASAAAEPPPPDVGDAEDDWRNVDWQALFHALPRFQRYMAGGRGPVLRRVHAVDQSPTNTPHYVSAGRQRRPSQCRAGSLGRGMGLPPPNRPACWYASGGWD